MTLFKGCHVIKCDAEGKPAEGEAHVLYVVKELSGQYQDHDPKTGEFSDYRQMAVLEKVK